jgi:hypothetical protein
MSADAAGPLAAAVLDSQQRALTLARDATEARVGALEHYAAQVESVDAAQQDWLGALRLSGLNSQYLDLVARTSRLPPPQRYSATAFARPPWQPRRWPFLPLQPPGKIDEPAGSPDSTAGRPVLALLTRLNAEGTTIVIVTYSQEIADSAPRSIRLRDGVVDHDTASRP